jgi:predicted transcriptional regulator
MAAPRKKVAREPKVDLELIGVRVEPELRRQLEDLARDDERTLSQLSRMALREFVERKKALVAA